MLLALEADRENSARSKLLGLVTYCLCRCCLTSIKKILRVNCAGSYFPSPSNLLKFLQHGCWFLEGLWCLGDEKPSAGQAMCMDCGK